LRTLPLSLLPLALLLLLLLLGTLAVALALLLAVAAGGPLFAGAALFLRARAAGALLELTHLLFHELPRLAVLLRAQFVMTAVRAALPPFRVCLFAA
jgi:hypothetical protein